MSQEESARHEFEGVRPAEPPTPRTPSVPPFQQRDGWFALAVFVAAAFVRGLALWDDADSLLYEFGGIDAHHYLGMARGLFLDEGLGKWPGEEPFFWAPGYGLYLGVLSLIRDTPFFFKLSQVLLGSASCVLVHQLARQLYSDVWVARVAAGFVVLCGPLVYFDIRIAPATLDVFLQLVLLVCLHAAYSARRSGWTSSALWFVAGCLAAFSAITRGGVLFFLPFVLTWWWIGGAVRVQRRGVNVALFLVPIAIALFATASHNARYDLPLEPDDGAGDDAASFAAAEGLVLVSSNLGINLAIGNNWALRDINDVAHPLCFLSYSLLLEEPTYKGVRSASGRSRYLVGHAVDAVFAAPFDWLKRMGLKGLRSLRGEERSRNSSIYASRLENRVLAVLLWARGIALPSGLLIPFGLVGLWAMRDHLRAHMLMWGCLLSQATLLATFFVTSRYRLPMLPLLSIYAAFVVVGAARRFRSGREPAARIAQADGGRLLGVREGLMLAVLLVVSNIQLPSMPMEHPAFEYNHLALRLGDEGRWLESEAPLRRALEVDPTYPEAHFHLATFLESKGDRAGAIEHLQQGLLLFPQSLERRTDLARLYAERGDRTRALAELERGLIDWPDSFKLRVSLCKGYTLAGQLEAALPHCQAQRRIKQAIQAARSQSAPFADQR